jgi:ClpP class serine protease
LCCTSIRPGGTVDGTEALANSVKSVEKPVVTFVDGLMASAAFWVGSQADEIIASTDTDEIGSVGVLLSFADLQPYWESLGIKFHKLVASTSPDKTKIWEDLRTGSTIPILKRCWIRWMKNS